MVVSLKAGHARVTPAIARCYFCAFWSARGLGRVKTRWKALEHGNLRRAAFFASGAAAEGMLAYPLRSAISDATWRLRPHGRQERLNTHDIHDPREIVREHVQGHLGTNLRQALHQKVRCAHAHLEGRERMLRRLASLAHRLLVLIETSLHGFEHMLMLPSG